MPVYDYECAKCGKVYEFEHGIKEDPPRKTCPECRGKLKKIFSPVGIVFKGQGFYINDSRKGGNGNGCVVGNGEAKKEESAECKACQSPGSCCADSDD